MEFLLQHLLLNSAARYPEREAARLAGASLTYRQLDGLANQVARTLLSRGLQRGDRVGIYVHKSFASLVGVFGILKAGGVYVPLDPNAPPKRLAYIIKDCDIRLLLTAGDMRQTVAAMVEEASPLHAVVLLDAPGDHGFVGRLSSSVVGWDEVLSHPDGVVDAGSVTDTDLAYILYTSGSTGVPKGVMITHRTIFTFINWCRDTFKLSSADRVTSHAPLHFDLSTFDIYATTQAGGTIILVPENLSTLPVQLADLLQDEQVTVTYLVPSILSLMVNYGNLPKHDLGRLRTVLFAGEVFPIKYLRRLVEALPHAEYYNLYGPTETNVCTYYKVQHADLAPERGDSPIPIGQACENIDVFAVDEMGGRVLEPGQEGELLVRGSCVAQGYWGDSAKTAQAFVPNPFSTSYQEIAYRTGDIVTLAPDRRNWIYKGRRDHMIKTRGYRVELAEIETALYRHADVREAVAVAVPDDLLGNRIRAFVVPAPNSSVTPKELESFCAGIVPKYMVPEKIELCEALPKTSSGKIDRPALLAAK